MNNCYIFYNKLCVPCDFVSQEMIHYLEIHIVLKLFPNISMVISIMYPKFQNKSQKWNYVFCTIDYAKWLRSSTEARSKSHSPSMRVLPGNTSLLSTNRTRLPKPLMQYSKFQCRSMLLWQGLQWGCKSDTFGKYMEDAVWTYYHFHCYHHCHNTVLPSTIILWWSFKP